VNVLDELAASVFRVEVSRVRMQSGYIGRLPEDGQSDPW